LVGSGRDGQVDGQRRGRTRRSVLRNVRVGEIAAEANQTPEGSTSVNSRISVAHISDSVKKWTTSAA